MKRLILAILAVLVFNADARTVVISKRPAGVTTYTAVTSSTIGTARSDFNGLIGCKFTANVNCTITHVGRWVISGNSAAHNVGIYNSSGTLIGTAGSVPTSGQPSSAFSFVPLTTSVSITSGSSYYIMGAEVSPGGDQWSNDAGTVPTFTADFTLIGAYYDSPPFAPNAVGASYGPYNFKYTKP